MIKSFFFVVIYTFLIFISVTLASTNDPEYNLQRYLHNTGGVYNGYTGTADADIDAPEAWAYSDIDNLSGGTVTIAIIGSMGYDYTDPEFTGRLRNGSTCLDYDGSALGGCIYGWNFFGPPYDPYINGGSHDHRVVSIVSAVKDNNLGIAGIAPNTEIMYILGPTQEQMIDFARYNEADILLLVYDYSNISANTKTALQNFSNSGGLVIAAALNNGNLQENESDIFSYVSNLLVVAGTDQNDELMDSSHPNNNLSSNYSPNVVHIAAPAVDIRVDQPESTGDNRFVDGNSFAAPMVAGVAALAWGIRPNIAAPSLQQIIMKNGDVIPSLSGKTIYGSRLNAYSTLVALEKIPDNFDFANIAYSDPGTYHTQQLTIAGLSGSTPIFTIGGEYRTDLSGAYMTGISYISNGDTLEIRIQTPTEYNYTQVMHIYVGTGTAQVLEQVTAQAHDIQPSNFSFDSIITNINTNVVSETISISGITTGAIITVDTGYYRINDGVFTTTTGLVESGDTVTLRLQSPSTTGDINTMQISIGSNTGSFSVEAKANYDRSNITPSTVFTDGDHTCTNTTSDITISSTQSGDIIYIGCKIALNSGGSYRAFMLFTFNTNTEALTHIDTLSSYNSNSFNSVRYLDIFNNSLFFSTTFKNDGGGGFSDTNVYILSGGSLMLYNDEYINAGLLSTPTSTMYFDNNLYTFIYGLNGSFSPVRQLYVFNSTSNERESTGSNLYSTVTLEAELLVYEDNLYLAYNSGNMLYISMFSGSDRSTIDHIDFAEDFTIQQSNNIDTGAYILISSDSKELSLLQFDGDVLSFVGGQGFYQYTGGLATQLTLYQNMPMVSFLDTDNTEPITLLYINQQRLPINSVIYNAHLSNTDINNDFHIASYVFNNTLYNITTNSNTGGNTIKLFSLDIDETPADFSASSQSNLELGASVDIASLTVSGITVPVYVTSTNAEVSINDGAYSTATGVVENGDTVSIRATTAAKQSTDTAVSISIGDLIKSLTLRTRSGGGGGGSSGGGGGSSSSSSASSIQNIKSSVSTTTETKTFANKSFDTTRISYTKNNYTVSFFLPDYSSFSDTIQEFVYDRLSPAMVNVLSKVSTTKQEAIIAAYQDVVYALYLGSIHSELKDTIDLTIENLIDILLNL